ncbi:helicase-related protein [Neorhizobium galegae]|uniref:helicase-related protein n=1 Tax=Neorhizobium galegae TaxID=399 RepID=UPI001F329832|nr:helicase-related protein [Neorhizobium galegae]UIK06213.1 helicase [Neorhizobium galegae]
MNAALAAFATKGSRRRYLVADEVGLGKTVVARDVVEALSRKAGRPLVVYYIANGSAVAHQNKPRLVEFLEKAEMKKAVRTPDRLSLVAVSTPPDASVAIYALSPDTSFPRNSRSSLSGGKAVERAFVGQLLQRAYPSVLPKLPTNFLQLQATSGWYGALAVARKRIDDAPPGLVARYRDALQREFAELKISGAAPSFAGRLVDLALLNQRAFIGRLRRALCLACLIHQPPDIIILDEFQKYRDLLEREESVDPLMAQLLKGNGKRPPALLLLSATPYRLFASRWEESQGVQAHREFFELVDFLAGDEVKVEAQARFKAFGDNLRLLVQAPSAERTPLIVEAAALRDQLQALLSPVIGRTERDGFTRGHGNLEPNLRRLPAASEVADVAVYRHLVRSSEPKRKADALAYWSSVPLPAQALGRRYAISRDRIFKPMRGLTALTRRRRDQLAPVKWPDAKLRALAATAPAEKLALPWIAPSLPWWDLSGAWAEQNQETKLLLFSRFKATPPAVASLLSFGVEARWIDRRGGYEKAYARRKIKLSGPPGPVMAAFHPSIWLIRNTDPATAPDLSGAGVRRWVRKTLKEALRALRIDVVRSSVKKRKRRRSIGRVLSGIEQRAGLTERSANAWAVVVEHDRMAKTSVQAWREAEPVNWISPRELEDLVTYAIAAPGVIVGRALWRHAADTLNIDTYPCVVRLSWQGLRPYLDNPILLSAIGGASAVDGILAATFAGNLESVLDEHLWIRSSSQEGVEALAKDLQSSLRLVTGGFSFHALGESERLRLRCHAAMPFGDAEAAPPLKAGAPAPEIEEDLGPVRPDEIRQSFNSPFWPYILATTSVGQEGLDFHTWCSRVVHWDLPSNPLDLEQREGRIQRYGGLSIRRRLGSVMRDDVFADCKAAASPWRRLASIAEARLAEKGGLSPWWILPEARVTREVFDRPFGRDVHRYQVLREQRFLYRLALGQPNQEDLLEILAKSDPEVLPVLQELTLDLCPFRLAQKKAAKAAPSGRGA